jgi:hypothetical protein
LKTAILHIGAHKTGSTSIQSSLSLSKEALFESGVSYFRGYDREIQLLSLGLRAEKRKIPVLKSDFKDVDELKQASRSSWMALARQTRRSDVPLTLISEEAMMRIREVDELSRLLRRIFDRVVIVAYVRNPALRFPSSVDQKVRGGASAAEITRKSHLAPRLLAKLERFEGAFGAENMVVRNFDLLNLVGGSPCSDFASVVSRFSEKPLTLKEVGPRNESLPASVTSALLKENNRMQRRGSPKTPLWKKRRLQLIDELRQFDGLRGGAKLRLEDGPLLGLLWLNLLPEVEAINERYLVGQVPIKVGQTGSQLTRKEVTGAFREWIESYRDPNVDEIVSLLRAMVNRPRTG